MIRSDGIAVSVAVGIGLGNRYKLLNSDFPKTITSMVNASPLAHLGLEHVCWALYFVLDETTPQQPL